MRPRIYENSVKTTIKMDQHTVSQLKLNLNGKSKNAYIVEKICWLRDYFKSSSEEEKFNLNTSLIPYASRRKLMGGNIDNDNRKDCIVSIKCEKDDYDYVSKEAGAIGLSFSEIIRRLVLRDLEEKK